MNRAELHAKHRELLAKRDASHARLTSEIEQVERDIQKAACDADVARRPKWHAATDEQRSYWHFMGFDPDDPDVPTD